MAKKRSASTVTPDYEAITSFQKGQASRIFKEVNEQDKVLIVSKQNKPQNVVISYERYKRLREEGFRVVTDLSSDRLNAKIRNAQKMKTPYMLIIGEKEAEGGLVSVRYRNGKQVNGVKTEDFIAEVHKTIDSKEQI